MNLGSRSAPLAVFALLLIALLVGTAAAAPKSGPRGSGEARIEVLSPAEGKRVNRALSVRLRVSSTADFRATVAGHDVTRRFERRGKLLEARLRLKRDFRRGENHLLVATGRGKARRATTIEFVSRGRHEPLLEASTSRTRSARTPLRVRLRVSEPVERLGLSLNGRRVRLGSPQGQRTWVVALGADNGLRFGRNSLSASAERTASGHFDRERLRFHLDRSAPLVGAGPDRLTRTGRAVTLDGSSTRAAGSRGLVYRWQIVKKPKRSRARIAASTAKVARLLPDLPGTYKVRLLAAPASAATIAAERRDSASASAEAAQPTCLQPAGSGASSSAASSDPLESPPCVTPFGDLTTPPLPLESRAAAAADVVEVTSDPTGSPLGWSVQTIAADGSIRIGPKTYKKQSGWARLLVLNQQSLEPESNTQKGGWGDGDQVFSLANAKKFQEAVEATKNRQIVVISGMGQEQSQAPKAAQEALAKAVAALGAQAPPSSERAEIVKSGEWSAIGTRSEPGRTFTNLYGLTEGSPPQARGSTLAGSLNGYVQKILTDAFAFVSPEYVPIDTRAEGSSNTVSVFTVGDQTATSETIGNGSLGLHLAAFETSAAGGLPLLVAQATYVIDDPYSQTDMAGVQEAAERLERWRKAPQDLLIVMQTFGEGAVGPNTAPWASPHWVNDKLIEPGSRGLDEWNGQAYLKLKHASEEEEKLDAFWNPGYPTVAGQVGDLTGPVGHDIVANLGAGNPNVEVTRLTMVANNHPLNTSLNYVRGFSGPAQGRLVGTLVRNSEAGWSVQSGVPSPAFSPQEMWSIVFKDPTPWPLSAGAENKAAMTDIAQRVFGSRATNVREEYVERHSSPWRTLREEVLELKYEKNPAFTEATFKELQKQLGQEMRYLIDVKEQLDEWRKFFTEADFAGFVSANELGSKIVDQAIKDAKQRETKEASLNAEAIISESLYTAADLVGFPEAYEEIKLAEMIGVVAGGFGLAEAATPEESEDEEEPNPAIIRDKAEKLGGALARHFEETTKTLTHMESIMRTDWGKLEAAGMAAKGNWDFSEEAEKLIQQSLSITTSQQLYEGLLPVAYDQWVVSPYFTVTAPNGPQPPGHTYACRQYTAAWESEETKHPFADEPPGALSTAIYRPWNAPGSTSPPAQPYTVPYTLRALKSTSDELKVHRTEYGENRYAVTVTHDGSSPPSFLVNPLFEPVNPGERHPNFPTNLGMSKVEFFAGFGEGPADWRRLICAQE